MGPAQMFGEHWWLMPIVMPLVMLTFLLGVAMVVRRLLLAPRGVARDEAQDQVQVDLDAARHMLKGWEAELPEHLLAPLLQRAEKLGVLAQTSTVAREDLHALALDLRQFNDDERLHEVADLRGDVAAVQRALQELKQP